jgi:predicted HTH transcriptional regulator
MRQLDLFSVLQSSTEGIDTEFKSARGGMPGSFWESYSAMANTQGGTIFLGVAAKSTGLVWEGVPDAVQMRTVLWGQLNDRHKVSSNLLRDDDVRTVEDEGRQFVLVSVPRASRLQRPVFAGPNPMMGTCRHRLGESNLSDGVAIKNVASCAHSTVDRGGFDCHKSVARALVSRVGALTAW